jgi:deazaflavin-dependent oxidoreductase (nitroreductase family)
MNGAKDRTQVSVRRLYRVKQWMYRGNRPGGLAKVMNRLSAIQFSAGVLSPERAATLEVQGRRSGRTVSFPVVVADHQGERYLVSMLGEDTNWVRNVRAAGGRAVLRRRHPEAVHLEEVEAGARAPILRRYLALAPGARPHIPVDRRAPLAEFERIAAQFPVFHLTTAALDPRETRDPAASPT